MGRITKIIIIGSGCIVGLTASILFPCLAYTPNYDKTITDLVDKIEIDYGESLSINNYCLETYSYFDKKLEKVELQMDMIEGYNPEHIGIQNPKLVYGDFTKEFEVKINPVDLEKPVLSLADATLKWSAIDGAGSYVVYLGGTINNMAEVITTNETEYSLASIDTAGDYFAKVIAKPESEKYIQKESDVFTFGKLSDITNIQFDGTSLTWAKVNNAETYTIVINDANTYHSASSSLIVPLEGLKVGENKITITASARNTKLDSNKANCSIYKVGAFTISNANNVLSWTESTNANVYDVYIDDELITTQSETTYDAGHLEAGIHDFKIVAKYSDTSIFQKDESATCRFYVNGEAKVEEDHLHFTKIKESGYRYALMDNGTFINSNLLDNGEDPKMAKVDIKNLTLEAGVHKFTISGINIENGEQIDIATIEATKLSAPSITYQDDKIVATNKLAGFTYFLDDVKFDGNLKPEQVGQHKVYAINQQVNVNTISSDRSNILKYNVTDAPAISIDNGKLNIDCDENYTWQLDNQPFDGNLANISEGLHEITARIEKHSATEVVESQISNTLKVNVLSQPSLEVTSDGMVKGNNLNTHYQIYIDNTLFNGKIEDLDLNKDATLTVVNVPELDIVDGVHQLQSKMSEPLAVKGVPNIDEDLTSKQGGKYYLLTFNTVKDLNYHVDVKYYDEGDQVVHTSSFDKAGTGTIESCSVLPSSHGSVRFDIQITVTGLNYLKRVFNITL